MNGCSNGKSESELSRFEAAGFKGVNLPDLHYEHPARAELCKRRAAPKAPCDIDCNNAPSMVIVMRRNATVETKCGFALEVTRQ